MKASRLGSLLHRFDKSGIGGAPVITDKELKELRDGLLECSLFMGDRSDRTMANALLRESMDVDRMILAREH